MKNTNLFLIFLSLAYLNIACTTTKKEIGNNFGEGEIHLASYGSYSNYRKNNLGFDWVAGTPQKNRLPSTTQFYNENKDNGLPNNENLQAYNTNKNSQKHLTYIRRYAPPKIVGKSAIVIDAHSGKFLYGKYPDAQRQVASTQKLLTAIVAIENGLLHKRLNVKSYDTNCEPTKLGLRVGQTYAGKDVLEAMLVKSGNDAARCLARNVAGSVENFASLMNNFGYRNIGLRQSHFTNASGLPDSKQYSTARDVAKIAYYSRRYSFIRNSVKKKYVSFWLRKGKSIRLKNTNKLLHNFKYCNGMKTGYTYASGRNLVATGSYNGRDVIVVVLGSKSPSIWNDCKKLLVWSLKIPEKTA